MTELKSGPLSPGMVSLLTAGRSVLFCTDPGASLLREFGPLVLFHESLELMGDTMVGVTAVKGQLFRPERFRYIGELADSAKPKVWITAPPGGWGSNPVGDRLIDTKHDNGDINLDGGMTGEDWVDNAWAGTDLFSPDNGGGRIIAFRLVEEASPVGLGEGSGSLADARTQPGSADRWADLERATLAYRDYAPTPDIAVTRAHDAMIAQADSARHRSLEEDFYAAANPSTVLELIAAARAKEAGRG